MQDFGSSPAFQRAPEGFWIQGTIAYLPTGGYAFAYLNIVRSYNGLYNIFPFKEMQNMKTKRILSMALALAMVLCVAMSGCGNNTTSSSEPASSAPVSSAAESSSAVESSEASSSEATSSEPAEEGVTMPADYDAKCAEVYAANLGEFNDTYAAAKAEVADIDKRYALEAVAEAKLLASAVYINGTQNGGRPGISRLVPHTTDYALWGSDGSRYHSGLVATEPIKAADRTEMVAKWNEVKGTGTYMEWVKGYLAEKGYELKDTYSFSYTGEPETFDLLNSSRATCGEVVCNTYDSLLEYDNEGTLQPALAESYEMSEDGLTYTFKIRSGVKWVDNQGREVADVKADDFVAGMQHMMDCKAGLESLVYGVILNAQEYSDGAVTDFAEVGVKAVDDTTLVYTLANPTPYFPTMLGYSIFAPMSRSYYESQGGTFGAEFEESGAGSYGTSPDTIAYCGPYLITNYTPNSTIVFSQNESYYAPEKINIKTINWVYNDGSEVTRAYTDLKAGITDNSAINTANMVTAKEDGWWDQYGYVSESGSTSYGIFINLNRNVFANARDSKEAVSPQTEEDAARTNTAVQNVHFRRAVAMSLDKTSWNAQIYGDDFATSNLRNSYTPGTFVRLSKDTSVDINGTATTFPAGTYYGEILQAQLDADGVAIKAWDAAADDGVGSSDGYDGWYNPEAAKAELATAVEELKAEGVEITAENPIQMDLPYPASSETRTNAAQVFKQSVEETTGGLVQINLVKCNDDEEWYYTGYYTNYGYEANFDLFDLSGWAPDYGDPCSYLDTFLPDYAGYVCKSLGMY